MCNAEKPQFCVVCRAAYCSRACQQEDWPLHKLKCKGFKLFPILRPDVHHKIGILFPVDAEVPKLIWIPTTRELESMEEQRSVTAMHFKTVKHIAPILGGEEETLILEHNIMREVPLAHQLTINSRLGHEELPVNKCILKLTQGKSGEFWRGKQHFKAISLDLNDL